MHEQRSLKASGICIGASTITWAAVERTEEGQVVLKQSGAVSHEGNPRHVLRTLFMNGDLPAEGRMAATGRRFRHLVSLRSIPEPEAVEWAYRHHLSGKSDRSGTVVSAGGETFMLYRMDAGGRVVDVKTGNKCASGTGEFFLQQLKRMNLTVDGALHLATLQKPYRVAGRCSVFCKSDCTHALNKGADKGQVVAGLCEMMAVKIEELLKTVEDGPVLLVGGSAANKVMTTFLRAGGRQIDVPETGRIFEALGAALWALEHETPPVPGPDDLFSQTATPFQMLRPLSESMHRVTFMEQPRKSALAGDVCVIGLDVGSTTTKAVVVRRLDKAILAGCYLRTNGDPVAASRACHAELSRQMLAQPAVLFSGLGVTGSGRRIAGLHALTPAIINEIIAHARAAAYFDPEVDTLFEIGGQDAKYTFLTNGVPSDYAMNEACSAGTGSFLEESAHEALHLKTEEIGDAALSGSLPLNFNDQCAAFIGSDIKTAIQSGLGREDIAAGLVYSICMNYLNRVKGNRATGRKILMQGGVCYNRAVPAAMAALTGKDIVVPPEPGMMGAYGVALEVDAQMSSGLLQEGVFNLDTLASRELTQGESFVCRGGRERCDRKCVIRRINIGERIFPFGGACSKYENVLTGAGEPDAASLDLVAMREKMLFSTYGTEWLDEGTVSEIQTNRNSLTSDLPASPANPISLETDLPVMPVSMPPLPGSRPTLSGSGQTSPVSRPTLPGSRPTSPVSVPLSPAGRGTIGMNRSLMLHSLFPLYHGFFSRLGLLVVLPEEIAADGCDRRGAAFCHPVEQAHGSMASLLAKNPDIIFLPHVKALPAGLPGEVSVACPFVQAEPYTMKAAFPELSGKKVLSPVLDMTEGYLAAELAFTDMAKELGVMREEASAAFRSACRAQEGFHAACREAGRQALQKLAEEPDKFAVILTGRTYNAMSSLGNMGIPRKLASRGILVIPQDFLPLSFEPDQENMYWASGRSILQAARFTARSPQMFGTYVTNFSCGPDSFLINYYRTIMGAKPSLTLELDAHTADAGIDTRIEAFLDVVRRYRVMHAGSEAKEVPDPLRPRHAQVDCGPAGVRAVDADGNAFSLTDPHVTVLVPSMGEFGGRLLAASLRHVGVQAVALPAPAEAELALGRGEVSCKECLPLVLTVGSMLRYIREQWDGKGILVDFMPETSGPCRFGQYNVMMREVAAKLGLRNVTTISLTAENGYAGFGTKFALRAWHAVVISDVMDDMRSAIMAIAADPPAAEAVFEAQLGRIERSMETDAWPKLRGVLQAAARSLAVIERKRELKDIPKVALIGEIYVRRDGFSRQHLVERLSRDGIFVRTAPVAEWIRYCDYIVQKRLVAKSAPMDRLRNKVSGWVKDPFETAIQNIFGETGLFHPHDTHVDRMVQAASDLVSPRLTGETILTIGAALTELVESVDGVLAIGPFGCMPARISEAVLVKKLEKQKMVAARNRDLVRRVMEIHPALPFLSIETDGNVFPQLVESRLEAFLMQVRRVHETLTSFQKDKA